MINIRHKKSLITLFLIFLFLSQISVATPITKTELDPQVLVQQGRQLYNSNQFAQAVLIWQQAAETFALQGNQLNQGMALSNLSLTYQQLGDWQPATQTINQSLNILERLEKTPEQQRVLAQTLDIQGQLRQKIGQSQAALITWQKSAHLYTILEDKDSQAIAEINQAQAMQDLGLYPRACQTLIKAIGLGGNDCNLSNLEIESLKEKLLNNQSDKIGIAKIRGLRSLGNVLRVTGNLQQSQQVLLVSLEIAEKWSLPLDESKALINLGNTERALAIRDQELEQTQAATTYQEKALKNYQKAENSSNSNLKFQAQINQLELLIQSQAWEKAETLLEQINTLIIDINLSREKTYIQISLAQNIVCLKARNPNCLKPQQSSIASIPPEAIHLLENARRDGEKLQDKRSQSYAAGFLGRIYEKRKEWKTAHEYTEQALLQAWQSQSNDLIYQWQWQLGRLFNSQGKIPEALVAYSQAVGTLKSLRQDLVSVNSEIQFTFRESVEPIYREYVSLLLQPSGNLEPNNLNLARQAIDSLQVAELENFFRIVCLDAKPVIIDNIDDPAAAIIYPILLDDRFEIILKLPKQPLRHYSIPIEDQKEVERIIDRLSQTLNQSNSQETLPLAQQVYDWLLRPLEQDLSASEVKTLVFILDTALRNVPMAVLYDGQKYLMEKYALALTPSLQLLDPKPLARRKSKVLLAGVSQARGKFAALPFVPDELQQIQEQVPSSVELLDQQFTNAAFSKNITSVPFPVVHLATHGQFSSQAESTFILTWDGPLDVNQLNTLLRSKDNSSTGAIELLVLSACETLTGDKRASLGLAGVAVRAGARSTLATLWQVNDQATAYLMEQFYTNLQNPKITKAEALRQAQISLLNDTQYKRPYYWAGYVLLGNWL